MYVHRVFVFTWSSCCVFVLLGLRRYGVIIILLSVRCFRTHSFIYFIVTLIVLYVLVWSPDVRSYYYFAEFQVLQNSFFHLFYCNCNCTVCVSVVSGCTECFIYYFGNVHPQE